MMVFARNWPGNEMDVTKCNANSISASEALSQAELEIIWK